MTNVTEAFENFQNNEQTNYISMTKDDTSASHMKKSLKKQRKMLRSSNIKVF